MKKSTSFMISATVILLALILPYPVASQTITSPSTTRTPALKQQQITKPALIPVPNVGGALISVCDSVGNPVGAATISMMVNGQSVTQLTNAQGDASFSSIPVGQYSYSVSKTGYYSPIPTMALSISGGKTTTSKYILFQYGSAKVKVTSNGNPVTGASVTATGSGKTLSQTTDAGGSASFSSMIQGSYLFSAGKADYANNQATVYVACGQEANVPITISKFGSAKVKVTCNGIPVDQAFVGVVYGNVSYGKSTDASGFVSFSNIPQGSYLFRANKTDYVGSQATVNIASGQEANVSMAITLNLGTLVVTVKDPNFGTLVGGAAVTISSADGTSQSATTNAQGIATFSQLKVGWYYVKASKAGYAPLIARQSVGISGYQPYQLTYSLIKLYTNVIVTVQKQGGQPSPFLLEGVTVSLLGSGVSQTLTTDSQGKVVFTYLQPGDYIVSVNKAGYIGSSKDVHIVYSGNITVLYLTMEMPAAQ